MEKTNTEKFFFDCSCGCGVLEFSQWKDDGISFIQYLVPAFTSHQENGWDKMKRRLEIFWNLVVLGKEYSLYEIVIEDNEKLRKFKEFVSNMKEIQ